MENEPQNPYAPPASTTVREEPLRHDSGQLIASRGQRLGASLIDGLLLLIIGIPIQYLMGVWDYILAGKEVPFSMMLSGSAISMATYFLLNGLPLHRYGQTLGKKAVGIRIAGLAGEVPTLSTSLFVRYVPFALLTLIPMIGNWVYLINVAFIFRKDHRCIHDHIANTVVLKV